MGWAQDTELAEQINRDVKRTHPDMQFFCGDNDYARENQVCITSHHVSSDQANLFYNSCFLCYAEHTLMILRESI